MVHPDGSGTALSWHFSMAYSVQLTSVPGWDQAWNCPPGNLVSMWRQIRKGAVTYLKILLMNTQGKIPCLLDWLYPWYYRDTFLSLNCITWLKCFLSSLSFGFGFFLPFKFFPFSISTATCWFLLKSYSIIHHEFIRLPPEPHALSFFLFSVANVLICFDKSDILSS